MGEKPPGNNVGNRIMLLVLACFFLSGLTGLVYEILWTRMIVKIIGTAPFAVSIVLTVFMGGLGLGSYVAGKYVDRLRDGAKALRIYGVLEIAIGLYGLVLPWLLRLAEPVCEVVYNRLFESFLVYNFLTFLICVFVLIIPVICMGATLPVLCRFYVTRLSHLGTRAGRLYGLNTIGAAVGSLVCGFWLIHLLGVWGTLVFAVVSNGLVGAACVLMGYKISGAETAATGISRQDFSSSDRNFAGAFVPTAALVVFAVSGFCAMTYEVIWAKLLGIIAGPTTYSFTIVLVTFISGLALGSMVFGRLADKVKEPLVLLLSTQIVAALSALAVSQFFGNSQLFFAKLIFHLKEHFWLLQVAKALSLFVLMVLPTICLGATFPIVGKIYTESVSKVGSSIGFAYAINTIGAVSGSFCAGFLIIPLVGKENGLSIVVGLQLCVAVLILVIFAARTRRQLVMQGTLVAAALTGVLLCVRFPAWNRQVLSTGKYHRFDLMGVDLPYVSWLDSIIKGPALLEKCETGELVYYGDGVGGFTTVKKYTDPFGNVNYSMANSGKVEASSKLDMATQTMLAHLPMLFAEDAKSVLVIGLASGITTGEVLHYPIERLDIVDINKQVVAASDFFLPWNNAVLSNPRTNMIIQDGRAHLQLTRQKYDVIISEPSNPWMAGMASLFTREFFESAKEKLNEKGVFVQWLQAYQMDAATFALVGRTFSGVFGNGVLVSTTVSGVGVDYLLIGFKDNGGLELENAKRNFRYAQESRNVKILYPELLYALVVSEQLGEFFGPGPVNTDNRPELEFMAPKLLHHSDLSLTAIIHANRRLKPNTEDMIKKLFADVDAQIDFSVYSLSVHEPHEFTIALSRATASQKERFAKLMEQYCLSNTIDYAVIRDKEIRQRCVQVQLEKLLGKIDNLPEKGISYFYLGNLYRLSDMPDEAISCYNKAIELDPDNPEVLCELGKAFESQKKFDEAAESYLKALGIRPGYVRAHFILGQLYVSTGRVEQAISHYRQAVKSDPDFAEAHYELAEILRSQGRFDEAITHYQDTVDADPLYTDAYINLGVLRELQGNMEDAITIYKTALKVRPKSASAHMNLGNALSAFNKADEAVSHFEAALEIDPNFAEAHYNLANVYRSQDRLEDAIEQYRQALENEPDFGEAHINLGLAIQKRGQLAESIGHLREGARLKSNDTSLLADIALSIVTHPDSGKEELTFAKDVAERAAELTGFGDPEILDVLASCYAASGLRGQAVETMEKALSAATAAGDLQMSSYIRWQLSRLKSTSTGNAK